MNEPAPIVAEPPLLSTHDLVLETDGERSGAGFMVGTMTAAGPRIACQGTGLWLVRCLANRHLIREGRVELLGRSPEEMLREGRAAYVPLSLPLPPSTRVQEAIVLSGRLVGADKSDAEFALTTCRLAAQQKRRLGELSRLQARLVSLAHGICASPEILILEDLFVDLDEAEIEIVESILLPRLDDVRWIAAVDPTSVGSRTLLLESSAVLVGAGTQLLPPELPRNVPADGYWVTCTSDAGALATELGTRGARVTKSPRASVLLVRGSTGSAIFQAARASGTKVLELSPHPSEGFPPTRATSGA